MIEINEELKKKVQEHFSNLQRGELGYCYTAGSENHIQVWTSLTKKGEETYKGVHYEYYLGDGHGRVQLHFEAWSKKDERTKKRISYEDFTDDKYRFFRDGLREETSDTSKYPDLKWEKWQQPKKVKFGRCIYEKEMNSEDDIIEGFEYLMEVFDERILKMIKKNTAMNKMNECKTLLESNHNLILTGAPGTGKTFLAKKIAAKMILGEDYDDSNNKVEQDPRIKEHCSFVQFHPSYDYTDFVEGLRPINIDGNVGFERQDGIFKQFCKEALKDSTKQYVFIIDEINRGDISKILGELFFSIDPGYRGEEGKVKTQYQNLIEEDDTFSDGFYVPKNVYIIGTMNDIDRSVESMDFAMRRRFAWKEITAESQIGMLDRLEDGDIKYPMTADEIAKAKNRLTNLNNEIVKEKYGLSAAYHIGPSYFLKLGLYKADRYESLWNNHIKGVLYEYLRGNEEIDELIEDLRKAYNNDQDKDSKVADKQEQTNEKASESEA